MRESEGELLLPPPLSAGGLPDVLTPSQRSSSIHSLHPSPPSPTHMPRDYSAVQGRHGSAISGHAPEALALIWSSLPKNNITQILVLLRSGTSGTRGCVCVPPGSSGTRGCVCVPPGSSGTRGCVCVPPGSSGTRGCVCVPPGSSGTRGCVCVPPGSSGTRGCVCVPPGSRV
uniref:Uncharacterized protein n=1 Tax=Knipowitschia caucasica TaxID=637954 RepID=A0AAV2J4B3_KNICA